AGARLRCAWGRWADRRRQPVKEAGAARTGPWIAGQPSFGSGSLRQEASASRARIGSRHRASHARCRPWPGRAPWCGRLPRMAKKEGGVLLGKSGSDAGSALAAELVQPGEGGDLVAFGERRIVEDLLRE